MSIDITAEVHVDREPAAVAAYMTDPRNDPQWIGGLREAELLGDGPVGVGSRVRRVAYFLGRRVEYVNEITELTDTRLAMRSVRSPFPMRVTYSFNDAGKERTEVSVRVEGDASRLYRLADPFLALMVRRSVQRDLRNLKRNLENGTGSR